LAGRHDARAAAGQEDVNVARLLERREADLPGLQGHVALRAVRAVSLLDLVQDELLPHAGLRDDLQQAAERPEVGERVG
jgi:hypothetical protein